MNGSIIESPLAKLERFQTFRQGETLYREGEEPRGVYVVHSGEIDLLFSSRNGHIKPLRVAYPGQILGLSSVVTNRVHDCTATARMSCEAGFIESRDLLHALDDRPDIWFSVLRLLSNDVNAAYNDMCALAIR